MSVVEATVAPIAVQMINKSDGVNEVAEVNSRRPANKEELVALCEHLLKSSDLEASKIWDGTMRDSNIVMAGFLDFHTQFQLSLCSKSSLEVVKKAGISVHRIEINDHEVPDTVFLKVQFTADRFSNEYFVIRFQPLDKKHTTISWRNRDRSLAAGEKRVTWHNCDYYTEAVRVAEAWAKKCRFQMVELRVEMMNYPLINSQFTEMKMPNCKNFRYMYRDEKQFRWWLEKLPTEIEKLEVVTLYLERRISIVIPSSIFDLPQVTNCLFIQFWCDAAITDDQLLRIRAQKTFLNATKITEHGINSYLRKWARGDGVKGFETMDLNFKYIVNKENILSGLNFVLDNHSVIRGYQCEFPNYFVLSQVNPSKMLTISITPQRVKFTEIRAQ